MCTTSEHNLHFYIMFRTSNYENDEIKQVNSVRRSCNCLLNNYEERKRIIRTWCLRVYHSTCFLFRCHRYFTFLKILFSILFLRRFSSFSFARFSSLLSYDVLMIVYLRANFSRDLCESVYESATIRKFWDHELSISIILC
jgi:hypothetical protein